MALQTTGTIKHSQIMAEFEHTGKFALSADGAALIDKTTGQIIKESDFYGAVNATGSEGSFGYGGCTGGPSRVSVNDGYQGGSQGWNSGTGQTTINGYCGWKLKTKEFTNYFNSWAEWDDLGWLCARNRVDKIYFSYLVNFSYYRGSYSPYFKLSVGGQPFWFTAQAGGGADSHVSGKEGQFAFGQDSSGSFVSNLINDNGGINRRAGGTFEHRFLQTCSDTYGAKETPGTLSLRGAAHFGNASSTHQIIGYIRMEDV